jgi:lipopolysaccharide transport system permease protein
MIMIYTLIFSQMMKARLGAESGPFAYSLYLCAGIFAWNYLSEVVMRSSTTLLENGAFLKKMSFPPAILFGATALSSAINFLIALGIYLTFSIFIKDLHPIFILCYLGCMVLLAGFALGLGMFVGTLNVFLRDVQQLTNVIFSLWFWFTPLVYLSDALPEMARKLLILNPLYPFIDSMHQLLYYDRWPAPLNVALMFFWSITSLLIGGIVYKKSVGFMRDQL